MLAKIFITDELLICEEIYPMSLTFCFWCFGHSSTQMNAIQFGVYLAPMALLDGLRFPFIVDVQAVG